MHSYLQHVLIQAYIFLYVKKYHPQHGAFCLFVCKKYQTECVAFNLPVCKMHTSHYVWHYIFLYVKKYHPSFLAFHLRIKNISQSTWHSIFLYVRYISARVRGIRSLCMSDIYQPLYVALYLSVCEEISFTACGFIFLYANKRYTIHYL
jgi:hypothetical protein